MKKKYGAWEMSLLVPGCKAQSRVEPRHNRREGEMRSNTSVSELGGDVLN
jgi:hypothetical protein